MRYFMAVPGIFLVSWVRGVSLGLMEAALTGHRLKSVSRNPMDYVDAMGGFVYMLRLVGWHKMDSFHNPRLSGFVHQWQLHLSAALASLAAVGCLQLLGMGSVHLMQAELLPESVIAGIVTMIYMTQIMLLGTIICHLIPLFPTPGYKLVQYFLTPIQKLKLTHYESLMALVLILMVMFLSPVLHSWSTVFVQKLTTPVHALVLCACGLVLAVWLFAIRRR